MYAIVKISGIQYRVEPEQEIFVPLLNHKPKEIIAFKDILFYENGSIKIGQPYLENMVIKVEVLEHTKGDKVIVFKKKRRKGYKKKTGHRQKYTKIQIKDIILDGDSQIQKEATVVNLIETITENIVRNEAEEKDIVKDDINKIQEETDTKTEDNENTNTGKTDN